MKTFVPMFEEPTGEKLTAMVTNGRYVIGELQQEERDKPNPHLWRRYEDPRIDFFTVTCEGQPYTIAHTYPDRAGIRKFVKNLPISEKDDLLMALMAQPVQFNSLVDLLSNALLVSTRDHPMAGDPCGDSKVHNNFLFAWLTSPPLMADKLDNS